MKYLKYVIIIIIIILFIICIKLRTSIEPYIQMRKMNNEVLNEMLQKNINIFM